MHIICIIVLLQVVWKARMDETLASKPSMSNCNTAEISILYGSITVHTETVDCTVGCRIFYGPIPNSENIDPVLQEELFGPQDAVQIALNPIRCRGTIFSLKKRLNSQG